MTKLEDENATLRRLQRQESLNRDKTSASDAQDRVRQITPRDFSSQSTIQQMSDRKLQQKSNSNIKSKSSQELYYLAHKDQENNTLNPHLQRRMPDSQARVPLKQLQSRPVAELPNDSMSAGSRNGGNNRSQKPYESHKDLPSSFRASPMPSRTKLEHANGQQSASLFNNTPISNMQQSTSKLHDLYRRHKQTRSYVLE